MRVDKFVEEKFATQGEFSRWSLWNLYQMKLLKISTPKEFTTMKSLFEYELKRGDKITLAGIEEFYGEDTMISIKQLKGVRGIGAKIIVHIQEAMGDRFAIEDLEARSKEIHGMGPKIIARIRKELYLDVR